MRTTPILLRRSHSRGSSSMRMTLGSGCGVPSGDTLPSFSATVGEMSLCGHWNLARVERSGNWARSGETGFESRPSNVTENEGARADERRRSERRFWWWWWRSGRWGESLGDVSYGSLPAGSSTPTSVASE